MGSPVSVVVAEIVMQHVEERALATCRQTIPLWLRYVDDTFTVVHKDETDDFHDHLNEQNADHIAVHHQLTNHNIDWDSAQCLTYSTNYFQRLTLESWYTNREQTPLNRCQQLPAPYKRLIHDGNETDKRTSNGPT